MFDFFKNFSFSTLFGGGKELNFDGEKDPHSMGGAEDFAHDHESLAKRSYESFLKSPQTLKIVEKKKVWLVGKGLQLQFSPDWDILKLYDIEPSNGKEYQNKVEKLFRLWANSKRASLSNEDNLHSLACKACDNTELSGDVLVVLRYDPVNWISVELVPASQVKSPPFFDENRKIVNGIEYNQYNQPIMFHVEQLNGEFIEIPARNKNGQLTAWMLYGLTGNLAHSRGISRMASILDLDKTVVELIEAMATSASENSKTFVTVEHGVNSTGENVLGSKVQIANTKNAEPPKVDNSVYDGIVQKINKTIKGQAYNMPNDSKLVRYNGEGANTQMTEFHNQLTDVIYSAGGVAPEIAKDRYEGSYSSGRLLMESQKQQFDYDRYYRLELNFYTPIFRFFAEILQYESKIEDFTDKITDPIAEEAFYKCSYLGIRLPDLDLTKKIKFIREALGPSFANIPIMTIEEAILQTMNADSDVTIAKIKNELQTTKDIKPNEPPTGEGNI